MFAENERSKNWNVNFYQASRMGMRNPYSESNGHYCFEAPDLLERNTIRFDGMERSQSDEADAGQ
jgi:hypothetical protein